MESDLLAYVALGVTATAVAWFLVSVVDDRGHRRWVLWMLAVAMVTLAGHLAWGGQL